MGGLLARLFLAPLLGHARHGATGTFDARLSAETPIGLAYVLLIIICLLGWRAMLRIIWERIRGWVRRSTGRAIPV